MRILFSCVQTTTSQKNVFILENPLYLIAHGMELHTEERWWDDGKVTTAADIIVLLQTASSVRSEVDPIRNRVHCRCLRCWPYYHIYLVKGTPTQDLFGNAICP